MLDHATSVDVLGATMNTPASLRETYKKSGVILRLLSLRMLQHQTTHTTAAP